MKATKQVNKMGYYEVTSCSNKDLVDEINEDVVGILFESEEKAIAWIEKIFQVSDVKVKEYHF